MKNIGVTAKRLSDKLMVFCCCILKKTKKDLNLPNDQKSLLIWDAFTGQNADAVKNRLSGLNILTVNVPKNLTHLLQPLDLTTNTTFKNIERKEFSNYFTPIILKELIMDPNLNVTAVSVDLRIVQTIKKARAAEHSLLDPYLYFFIK